VVGLLRIGLGSDVLVGKTNRPLLYPVFVAYSRWNPLVIARGGDPQSLKESLDHLIEEGVLKVNPVPTILQGSFHDDHVVDQFYFHPEEKAFVGYHCPVCGTLPEIPRITTDKNSCLKYYCVYDSSSDSS